MRGLVQVELAGKFCFLRLRKKNEFYSTQATSEVTIGFFALPVTAGVGRSYPEHQLPETKP